jgi:hypothetical protein
MTPLLEEGRWVQVDSVGELLFHAQREGIYIPTASTIFDFANAVSFAVNGSGDVCGVACGGS